MKEYKSSFVDLVTILAQLIGATFIIALFLVVVIFTLLRWYDEHKSASKVSQQIIIDGNDCGCVKHRDANNSGPTTSRLHVK